MSLRLTLLALCVSLLAGPLLALVQARPVASEVVVVLIPPWLSADAVVTQAGGRVIGPERAMIGRFATFADADFVARVRQAGGWGVLNGRALAALCGVRV